MNTLLCNTCGKTVAKITEKGFLKITMKGRKVINTGQEYTTIVSCSFCKNDNIITIENGKTQLDNLNIVKEI